MNLTLQKIVELERINPTIMQGLSDVVPGIDVVFRDDIVMISSKDFPSSDTNLAYLFRATTENADSLIEEVVEYFQSKDQTPKIMVSPACTPADLSQRLETHGFVRQKTDEAWVVLENLQNFKLPKVNKNVVVRRVENKEDVETFAGIMAAAYEMPSDWIPYLAQMLEPTISVAGLAHYLSFVKGVPAATLTLMRHKQYVTMGSAGVMPEYRGTRTIFNLAAGALAEAKREGVDTVVGQTSLGPKFERYLRIVGFKPAFRRTEYKLE
jgi:hypothetical protein